MTIISVHASTHPLFVQFAAVKKTLAHALSPPISQVFACIAPRCIVLVVTPAFCVHSRHNQLTRPQRFGLMLSVASSRAAAALVAFFLLTCQRTNMFRYDLDNSRKSRRRCRIADPTLSRICKALCPSVGLRTSYRLPCHYHRGNQDSIEGLAWVLRPQYRRGLQRGR
jgi:hypothetical protein